MWKYLKDTLGRTDLVLLNEILESRILNLRVCWVFTCDMHSVFTSVKSITSIVFFLMFCIPTKSLVCIE